MIDQLKKINEMRDNGEISKSKAQSMKYELMLEVDKKNDKEEVFDKGCTT